jgi:amidophosphoribosyltransferase
MCGIIGAVCHEQALQDIYDGLIALQHRGQDAAGIMTFNDRFHVTKRSGLVQNVFKHKNVQNLQGNLGIGHVRYTTTGSAGEAQESQPFFVNSPFGIGLIHNGNLTNYEELHKELVNENHRYLNTNSDTEVLANVLAEELAKCSKKTLEPDDMFCAVKKVFERVKGSYSVITLVGDHGLLVFRDPHGIRPLVLGSRNGKKGIDYFVASEGVAFDILNVKLERDVQPGEAVFIDKNTHKVHSKQLVPSQWAPCIFEWVYLARPDSTLDNVSVYKARLRMGESLARKVKVAIEKGEIEIDTIIPVPDTSRPVAQAMGSALSIRVREGLIKNRYIGRTFIMPDQKQRKKSIRYKLNPIPFEIRNKNVLLVDDSIVRGNTARKIIELVRNAGARKVYIASAAPPLRHPCVYGVDLASRSEYVAHNLDDDGIAKAIGADGIFYQELEDLHESVMTKHTKATNFCDACFTGKYPTKEVDEDVLARAEASRSKVKTDEMNDSQLPLLNG